MYHRTTFILGLDPVSHLQVNPNSFLQDVDKEFDLSHCKGGGAFSTHVRLWMKRALMDARLFCHAYDTTSSLRERGKENKSGIRGNKGYGKLDEVGNSWELDSSLERSRGSFERGCAVK